MFEKMSKKNQNFAHSRDFWVPVFTRESTFWQKMAKISPLRSSKMHDFGVKINFEVV